MLYVFHVDNGAMMTFHMDFALTNVQKLKKVIQEKVGISVEKQVLLISGGEALLDVEDVCHYSAGTDTNPIFLYNLTAIENFERCSHVTAETEYAEDPVIKSTDIDIKEQVEASSKLAPGSTTILSRARLAHYMFEVSRDQLSLCEESVLHQHLQQQGWAAVVANLEDILVAIAKKFEMFEKNFQEYLRTREIRKELLDHFDEDILLLKKIPLLPALSKCRAGITDTSAVDVPLEVIDNQMGVCYSVENITSGGTATEQRVSDGSKHSSSLLDWIDAKDIEASLNDCRNKLAKFDGRLLKQILTEYSNIAHEGHEKPEFKEIKGLGERLSHLDSLMRDGRRFVEEQKVLAESFYQNKTRSGSVKDESVYRNLCQSQVHYMRQMHINYSKLSDIRKRCNKAKFELSENIIRRLNWIVFLEHRVTDLDGSLVIYGENMRRMESELKVFEQIHQAPQLYFSAISEVVRRQVFSKQFLQWSSQLSFESKEILEKEVLTRRKFTSQFSTHFLNNLFPGLSDFPPPFATEKPKQFDELLPRLSEESLESLRMNVPELAHLLILHDVEAIPAMVERIMQNASDTKMVRQRCYGKEDGKSEMFSSVSTSSKVDNLYRERSEGGLGSSPSPKKVPRPSSILKDQPESETDTEDFEKVCSSMSDDMYSPMESLPDVKESNIKLCSSSLPSYSKHIKLDYGQSSDSSNETLVQSNGKTVKGNIMAQNRPDEFVSPDFLIADSSNSCYDDASAFASHADQGSASVTSAIELQKTLEEKNFLLLQLQSELRESTNEVEKIQSRLKVLTNWRYGKVIQDLKEEMEGLKGQVKEDGSLYLSYISDISSRLLEIFHKMQLETEASNDLAVQNALSVVRSEEDQRSLTLRAQLADTNRELEIYQDQIRSHLATIERLQCEMEENRHQLMSEMEETVKKLTLEHELEMDAMKEQCHKEEIVRGEEISSMQEELSQLKEAVFRTEREKASMEHEYEKKFEAKCKEKEENICQILAASFSEREKKNLETQKRDLEHLFNSEKAKIQKDHQESVNAKLKELKENMEKNFEERISREREEAEQSHSEELRKCRELWEAHKEEELELTKEQVRSQVDADCDQKCEKLKAQYKMDLEGLRFRFRMMTTANMEKSPSETSLEKLERGEYIEVAYHEMSFAKLREQLRQENEEALEKVTSEAEEKHRKLLEEEMQKYQEKNKEEIRKMEAEKQKQCNVAFKEMIQDKDRVIEDLRLRVEVLTGETDRLKKGMHETIEEKQPEAAAEILESHKCDVYKKEIQRLENELERVRRLSFVCEVNPELTSNTAEGTSETASIPPTSDSMELLQKFEQENRELKSALERVSCDRKRIALDDARIHDLVLVVWDELYWQYRILLEYQPFLHFLHCDSYAALGLSKGPERPEKLFCTAQVTKKKEFCQAKRDGNRFRVPKGTKFYRVQAGPPCSLRSPTPSKPSPDQHDFASDHSNSIHQANDPTSI